MPLSPGPESALSRGGRPCAAGTDGSGAGGGRARGPTCAHRLLPWASPRTWLRAVAGWRRGGAELGSAGAGDSRSRPAALPPQLLAGPRFCPPNPDAPVGRHEVTWQTRVHDARARGVERAPSRAEVPGDWECVTRRGPAPSQRPNTGGRSGHRGGRGRAGTSGARGASRAGSPPTPSWGGAWSGEWRTKS